MVYVLLGLEIRGEEKTNRGRMDNVLELEDKIFIFEMKYEKSARAAIDQIREKNTTRSISTNKSGSSRSASISETNQSLRFSGSVSDASSFFKTLPEALRGRVSTKQTDFGAL